MALRASNIKGLVDIVEKAMGKDDILFNEGADLAAATVTNILQGDANGTEFTVSVLNRGTVDATFRLGLSTSTTVLDDTLMLEYDLVIPSGGVLERTAQLIKDETLYLLAYSDVVDVTVTVHGRHKYGS